MARTGYHTLARSVIETLEPRQLLSGNFEWAVTFGQEKAIDSGNAIAVDADGSVYVAGNFEKIIDVDPRRQVKRALVSDDESQDVFLAKYNSNGKLVWAQRFGGKDDDTANAIAIGPDGDVYVAGTFDRSAGFGARTLQSHGRRDVFVTRVSPDGEVRWAGNIGGRREDYVNALKVDANGDVFISGTIRVQGFVNPGAGKQAITARGVDATYVSRLGGADGELQWIRNYGEENTFESAQSLAPDGDGGVYVAGSFNRTVQFQPGNARFTRTAGDEGDLYLGHINAAGNWDMLSTFGGKGEERVADLAFGPGGLFLTGTFDDVADFDPGARTRLLTPAGDADVFIARYTTSGRSVWTRQIGGKDGQAIARGIAVDGGGNVHVAGTFDEEADLDPNKGILFVEKEGRSRAVRPRVAPVPFSVPSGSGTDTFIVKLNASGGLVYGRTIGGEDGAIEARGLAVDDAGSAWLTGTYAGEIDLNPGRAVYRRDTGDERKSNHVFVLKLDA